MGNKGLQQPAQGHPQPPHLPHLPHPPQPDDKDATDPGAGEQAVVTKEPAKGYSDMA